MRAEPAGAAAAHGRRGEAKRAALAVRGAGSARARRAHDALMLRRVLRLQGAGAGWAWLVDELEDLLEPGRGSGGSRAEPPMRCMAGLCRCDLQGAACSEVGSWVSPDDGHDTPEAGL